MVCASCSKQNDSLKRCAGCQLVYYCGRECQVAHRKAHKKLCRNQAKKLKVKEDTGLSNSELDKPLVVFFVDRFVTSLMFPLLGTPDPAMWNILFKRQGAKERVHAHMLTFTVKYLSSHSEYHSEDAMKRLLETDYVLKQDREEPILSAMREELYAYLKEVEEFMCF